MSRLIDADLLGLTDMEIIMCDGDYKEALKMLIDKIEHAPTIEPQQTCEYWDSESKFCALYRPSAQPQPEEDCDTCKHGYFGDRQCDNCRVRYPSHYEREEEQHGSD